MGVNLHLLNTTHAWACTGVPAHDERDYVFAQEHGLPVVQVVTGEDENNSGVLVHSEQVRTTADYLDLSYVTCEKYS